MDFERELGRGRPLQALKGVAGSAGMPTFDPVLLELGEAGEDGEALLFRKYRRRLCRYFETRGFEQEEAQDLTQETFLRVYRGEAEFLNRAQLEGWLFEIAHNVARNAWRGRNALKRAALEISLNEPEADGTTPRERPDPAFLDGEADALTVAITHEQRTRLREALEELPEQMRHCVRFRLVSGLKYREIALVMKISIETVKSHLYQAKKRLKERLEPLFGPIDF